MLAVKNLLLNIAHSLVEELELDALLEKGGLTAVTWDKFDLFLTSLTHFRWGGMPHSCLLVRHLHSKIYMSQGADHSEQLWLDAV